ncbi:hypothetical protein, partial [Nocardioides abyssi]
MSTDHLPLEPTAVAGEMHPSRWGDPARATALPEAARGRVEAVFGLDEQPAVADVVVPRSVLAPAHLDA